MSIPPERIEVGKCYLAETGQVRRVLAILPVARVQYEQRPGHLPKWPQWKSGVLDLRSFAFAIEREVPCDWTPETDE